MTSIARTKQSSESCGCCDGVHVLTPIEIFNRPLLDAIGYRVGTHGSFLETMKAKLSSSEFPELARLTTRDGSDPSLALLDAWATVADVLTFYQERIAAEGYLRTATERRSILELARLVGYRLRPGVAASVYLAYILEPTQETSVIEPGNQAQSIPGPNELPQVFETADLLVAHAGLNLMKPRLTQPRFFESAKVDPAVVVVKGVSTNVRANDGVLLDFTRIGDSAVVTSFYTALEISPEPQFDRTTLRLAFKSSTPEPPPLPDPSKILQAVENVLAIAKRYLDLDAFAVSEKSKTIQHILLALRDLKQQAQAAGGGTAKDSDREAVLADARELISKVVDQYEFAVAHGYDKIASWLDGLRKELDAALAPLEGDSNGGTGGYGDREGGGEGRRSTLADDSGPSFVELFQPFKRPQSVQPANEARLGRQVGQIYSGRSEFVSQLYGTLQPKAAPFLSGILSNAGSNTATIATPKTRGILELTKVQALRLKASLAGHNFPVVVTVQSPPPTTKVIPHPNLGEYIFALHEAGYAVDGEGSLPFVALDAKYDQIVSGTSVAIEYLTLDEDSKVLTNRVIGSVVAVETAKITFSEVSLSVTVLKVAPPWLPKDVISAMSESDLIVRSTAVHAQSEELNLAETQILNDIGAVLVNPNPPTDASSDPNPPIELDGLYSNLEPGRWVVISGERVVLDPKTAGTNNPTTINTGVRVSELMMVGSVSHEAKTLLNGDLIEAKGEKLHTFIRPAQAAAYTYKRDTVSVYGNVVRASHGETRNEVLGSGDGSRPLQAFPLRQPPLTYVASPTPSGVESTLEVRVNDVRWHESDNLFVLESGDRSYVTKADDDGKTSVIFGNGIHGARVPTGVENVTAVYRSGIGSVGNVRAEQIKLPLTKPLGVKGVINPLPASGGADKETRDQARHTAPIAILALDRLVSVQDYADFARSFAGIAKANATRLSDGTREVIHVTIAGAGNIPIDLTSDLYRNLIEALKRFGDPVQPLEVDVFERVLLVISAKVSIDPDYLWEKVKPRIREELLTRFGFESRELGQPVPQSEVLSVIQAVPGVIYVDLDLLDSVHEEKLKDPNFGAKLELKPRVNASLARLGDAEQGILPAQLVFLSPGATDTLILEEVAR